MGAEDGKHGTNFSGRNTKKMQRKEANLGQAVDRKLVAETWAPTREEEQAVSMDSDGPFSPSVKLMRPHTTLRQGQGDQQRQILADFWGDCWHLTWAGQSNTSRSGPRSPDANLPCWSLGLPLGGQRAAPEGAGGRGVGAHAHVRAVQVVLCVGDAHRHAHLLCLVACVTMQDRVLQIGCVSALVFRSPLLLLFPGIMLPDSEVASGWET